MKIVLVNGAPGVGKTSFEEFCWQSKDEDKNEVVILSTITPIKTIAKKIGWDGEKTPENRKFLSDLKDLLTNYNDYSINWIKNMISIDECYYDEKEFIYLIDTREPKEIERLKKEWNAKSLLIRRADHNPIISNHADKEVEKAEYDWIIDNDGTIEDLKNKANKFIINLSKLKWKSEVK